MHLLAEITDGEFPGLSTPGLLGHGIPKPEVWVQVTGPLGGEGR